MPVLKCWRKVSEFRFRIVEDDLRGREIAVLLQEHLDSMYEISPPGSVHALDLEALRAPEISFWTAWDGPSLAGCGALRMLDATHAEIKSMRTDGNYLRKGVAAQILAHLITVGRARGYHRLSLETGNYEAFVPAHRLYERFGFQPCDPFGGYRFDPISRYYTLQLWSQTNPCPCSS